MIRFHLFRHLGLKVLAVGLAVLLWLAIAGEPFVERGVRAPLELQNIPAGLEIVGDTPSAIDVRVRGSSAVLSRLEPGDVVAVLDVGATRSGRRLFHLSPSEVRAPFGVDVAQVTPSTIQLRLERSGRRFVPVVPAIEGDPAPGFIVGRVSTQPASVEVVGPISHLVELAEAITEPVSVLDATATVREIVTVGVADSVLRLTEAQSAQVEVEIVPAPSARVFRDVPVRLTNLDPTLTATLTTSLVRVTVHGPRDRLRDVRPDTVEAFVDLAGLAAGRHSVRVQVNPTRDLTIGEIDPATLEIQVR